MLAEALMAQDPRRNLDEAIRQSETAWEILSPLPPARIFQQTPAALGLYCRLKGDSTGDRSWYEKSLALLLRAREASQAYEKAYDEAQLAHGKPLATRVVYLPVYLSLGATYTRLGRYSDAVDAYRYARDVDPRNPEAYDGMAAAYLQSGSPRLAAVALEQKAAVEGLTAATLAQIGRLYGQGSCAVEYRGSTGSLNLACPPLHEDMCAAWSELATALTRARLPDASQRFRGVAAQNACPPPGK
jgi:tetratricopeptide (TPR) repeat protein